MPYAVVRRPALLLPTTVVLDDLVSMSGEHKLSTADQFEVVARISRTGNAVPDPSDWQWVSAAIKATELPVQLNAQLRAPVQ